MKTPIVVPVVGYTPKQAHTDNAAYDLSSKEHALITLYPGERAAIDCGLNLAITKGHVGMVCPRSGLAAKHGVTVLNSPGIIDPSYRGSVVVVLINLGQRPFEVRFGDRIAQLLIVPTANVIFFQKRDLNEYETDRGNSGFGSTGTRLIRPDDPYA